MVAWCTVFGPNRLAWNVLKNRFINLCASFTFLSKGHSDALNSEEKISFFVKNFLKH